MTKLKELKANIGEKLFNQLNPAQRELIAETAGVIKFRQRIDINEVYRFLKNCSFTSGAVADNKRTERKRWGLLPRYAG